MTKIRKQKLILQIILFLPIALVELYYRNYSLPKDYYFGYLYWSGIIALTLLSITISLSSLKQLFPSTIFIKRLTLFRRQIGIASCIYAIIHLLGFILKRIVKNGFFPPSSLFHPALFPGTLALIILLVLTATSNNYTTRKMGFKQWKKLHGLVYYSFCLATLHITIIALRGRSYSMTPSLIISYTTFSFLFPKKLKKIRKLFSFFQKKSD